VGWATSPMAASRGGVDDGGAGAEEHGAGGPGPEPVGGGDQGDGGGLGPHAGGDEPLAADAVGHGAGNELAEAPHRRVERGEDADAPDGAARPATPA
jgi:hypothetical protein